MMERVASKCPWVIVAGDFNQTGGMDRANYHLAWYLADNLGHPVHVVAHRCADSLRSHANVTHHPVMRPFGRHSLGEIFLDRIGRNVAAKIRAQDPTTRVLVNGGNCNWPDLNWVHYVHGAYPRLEIIGPWWFQLRRRWIRWRFQQSERRIVGSARVVIANSDRTRSQLIELLKLPAERVHRIYLGVDPQEFSVPGPDERARAREKWQVAGSDQVAVFIGALGFNANKGFDTVLAAAELLPRDRWQVLAAGDGPLDYWQKQIDQKNLTSRVRLIGHTKEIATLMAAADLLVSPTRFEPYGLAVHEALCRGLPAVVSSIAGVAERYPEPLRGLLLQNPNDPQELATRMADFEARRDELRRAALDFGAYLRSRTWTDVAADIVNLASQYS